MIDRVIRSTLRRPSSRLFFQDNSKGTSRGKPPGGLDVRNSNMRKVSVNIAYAAHHGLFKANTGDGFQLVTLDNFWVEPNAAYPFLASFSPSPTSSGVDGSGRTYGEWTGKDITGRAYSGIPPAGDFCPVGVSGVNYVSPGYL